MEPRKRLRTFGYLSGLLFLALSGLNLWRAWSMPADTWWTPAGLALPLEATRDSVQVLVDGVPLDRVLAEGRLQLRGPGGEARIGPAQVRLRLNHLDRIRSTRLVAAGTGLGAAMAVLLTTLLWSAATRQSAEPPAG